MLKFSRLTLFAEGGGGRGVISLKMTKVENYHDKRRVGFLEGGKPENLKKILKSRTETNNKLNTNVDGIPIWTML